MTLHDGHHEDAAAPLSDDDRLAARLSAWLDGDLSPVERADVDALLAGSVRARTLLAELRDIRDAAAALRDTPAARDLWPDIAARTSGARRSLALPLTAAAALLLLAAGLTWWLVPRAPENRRMAATLPRYLLLLHETPSDAAPPPPGELAAIIARYAAWSRERAVLGEKLSDDGGLLLRGTDAGPLPPSGDIVGGLFIIEAADDAAARAIAATCPHLDFGGSIELRRIEDT